MLRKHANGLASAGGRGGSFSGLARGQLPVQACALASTRSQHANARATANGPAPDPPRPPSSNSMEGAPRPTKPSTPQDGLPRGTIIALSIAGVVSFLSVLILGFVLWRRHRPRSRPSSTVVSDKHPPPPTLANMPNTSNGSFSEFPTEAVIKDIATPPNLPIERVSPSPRDLTSVG